MYLQEISLDDDSQAGLGQPVALPRVTEIRFRNSGTTDANNCCCFGPVALGVGAGGRAQNGMELRFRISGHRPGIEYDITRTRRDSLWQRVAGVWANLGASPMGTRDDHRDEDECLSPRREYIFAVDLPGIAVALPAPAQGFDWRAFYGPAAITSAAAQDVVVRASFAEWVIARSKGEGIPWTPIELPPRTDGTPRRFVFWRCVVWLTADGAGNFVLNVPRSRIELGSISATVINAAPA